MKKLFIFGTLGAGISFVPTAVAVASNQTTSDQDKLNGVTADQVKQIYGDAFKANPTSKASWAAAPGNKVVTINGLANVTISILGWKADDTAGTITWSAHLQSGTLTPKDVTGTIEGFQKTAPKVDGDLNSKNATDKSLVSFDATTGTLTISKSVKTIGQFDINSGDKEIIYPEGTFEGHDILAINFEEGSQLQIIGNSAFANLTKLKSVTIPYNYKADQGGTHVLSYAFLNAPIESLTMTGTPHDHPLNLGLNSFFNTPTGVLKGTNELNTADWQTWVHGDPRLTGAHVFKGM